MNEIMIVMGAIVVVGLLPIIAVAILAYRALKKSFKDIEQHLDERSNTINKLDDLGK